MNRRYTYRKNLSLMTAIKSITIVFAAIVFALAVVFLGLIYGNNDNSEKAYADGAIEIEDAADFVQAFYSTGTNADGKTYILTKDITLTNSNINNVLISSEKYNYTHKNVYFDGNFHTITLSNINFYVQYQGSLENQYFGLFGSLENSLVKNLKIDGTMTIMCTKTSVLNNNIYLGVLAGRVVTTTIDNVWSNASSTFNIGGTRAAYIGGLVGAVSNANSGGGMRYVKNILLTGKQYCTIYEAYTNGYVGGLAGKLSGKVKNISQYSYVYCLGTPNGFARCGGVFATTAASEGGENTLLDIEYAIYSNKFQSTPFFAFPQTNSLTEKKTQATINGKTTEISTCLSFSIADPYRFSSNDEEQFTEVAKAVAFDRQFFAYKLYSDGQRFSTEDGPLAPEGLPMLCWKTLFDNLPVPTSLTNFFEPVSPYNFDAYEIGSSEEFNDMSLFQSFSSKYKNKNLRLKSKVEIDDDFLPFQAYEGVTFDGNGYSIMVPEEVTLAAIKAGIFASIDRAKITNINFFFYGKFTSPVAAALKANNVSVEQILSNYDAIVSAINEQKTDIKNLTDYAANKKKGTWNHAAFICYAKASASVPYEISRIMIDFNGTMETSSKYWNGEDSTTARAGALVGEEYHYVGGVSPKYENCLIYWRGGMILDSALPTECNGNDGIYVRLDVGVFWNGSDQNTVKGLSKVWTIAKNGVLSGLNTFKSRGSVVTGCLIKEMNPNTINASMDNGITSFYLMDSDGVESIVTKELLTGNLLDESKVICSSEDGIIFDPNTYAGETQTVLYAYIAVTVKDYIVFDDGSVPTFTVQRYLKGSIVERTFNPETDTKEGKCFFGFNNNSDKSLSVGLIRSINIIWTYLTIKPQITEAVYTGNEINKEVSKTFGKTVTYSITYSASESGPYNETARMIDAGFYRVTATYSNGSVRLGSKTYNITVHKAAFTVTPAMGQKAKKSEVSSISDINIEYACASESLVTGSLTLADYGSLEVRADYEIVLGTLRVVDEVNYYIDFVPGVTYEICQSFVTIEVADKEGLTKPYDGTSTVSIPYTVVEGEVTTDSLCVLNIGDKTEVGEHQILVSKVATGYDVKLIREYFKITKRTVTVVVTGGTEKQYDKTNDCTITFRAEGLVSSDVEIVDNVEKPKSSVFSGALSYDGGYDVNTEGYPITIGSLSSKNYNIILNNNNKKYVISQKQIYIYFTAGQSRGYNRTIPNDIEYTYTDDYTADDRRAITLPYGDVFTGALTLDNCTSGDVLYDEKGEISEYKIIKGDLDLGSNYNLNFEEKYVGLKIIPREVADITFSDIKEVEYTPNSNVRDIIETTLGTEVLSEDRLGMQPIFKLYKYHSENGWVEMEGGTKPGIGTYKCVTTGEFTNRNYRILKIGDKYLEFSTEFTIVPFELTKANFDFADVTTEFSGTTVSVGIGTTERESGNDYPGVELYSSRFEDQNNNSSDGMLDGVPYLAGIYRQICVFKCSENYSCTAIASTTNTDYIEIKRNIIVEKKALNISIRYNNTESRTTPYLARSVTIDVKAYGNTLQESVTLDRAITLDGLTADSILYVGTYSIKYTFNPSDGYYIRNYRLSDGSTSDETEYVDEFVVTKATPTVRSIVASDIIYETSVGSSVITATLLTPQGTVLKDGTFSFTKPNVVPDAGYYEAEVAYTPGNTYEDKNKNIRYKDNYNSFFTKVIISIIPQTVVVTPKAGSTQEYDEGRLGIIEYTTGTIADKSLYGIQGALSAVALDGTEVTNFVANTSYQVTIGSLKFVKYDGDGNPVDTDNYVLSLENGTHTITPKKIPLVFSDFNTLQYNYSLDTLPCKITQSASGNATVISEIYLLKDLAEWIVIENPFDKYGVCKMLNAGYYKVISSVDDANYTVDDATASYYFSVERMVLPLTCVEYESTTFDYNGNVRAIAVKEALLPPDLVINYKNNANVYAGTYTVSVFVTSKSKNYTLGGVALSTTDKYEYKPTVTINKYKVTEITVAGIDELIYNGAELSIVADFVGVRTEDNVKKTYVITRNGVVTKPIEAGDYTMTVDIQENDNYELDESCENVVEFTIKKQKLGLQSLQTIIKVYNGNTSVAVTPSMFELKGIIGNDEVTIADGLKANFENETTGINKEIIVSDVTLGGADKDNYYVDTALIKIAGNIEAKRYDNTADSGLDLAVVPIKDSNIPLDATLKANLDNNDNYKSLKKILLNNNEEIFKVFTYGLYGENGDEVALTNPVKLSLNTEGSQIKIYTLNGEELTEVEYTINGTYAEFNASAYQKYVVTVERKPNNVLAPLFKSPFFYVGLVLLAGGITAIIVITVKKRKGVVK